MGLYHKLVRNTLGNILDSLLLDFKSCDKEKEYLKIIDKAERYMSKEKMNIDYDKIKALVSNESSAINKYLNRVFDSTDSNVLRTTALNLGFEAMLHGTRTIRKNRKKYGCNIPWLILMDPTSACNLHCTGCWAAEYGNKSNLTYEEMSDIVNQGKKLGVYFYMFTGGEPLVRINDILRLCEENKECVFLAYTNGTLIDTEVCENIQNVGNLMLAISIEGDPEVNDLRRGTGVYSRVMKSMQLLQEYGLIYGASICYTSKNYKAVTNTDFIKLLVENGCKYALYFHYMPVGNNASEELLPTPEERIYMMDRVRAIRKIEDGEGLFTMDFQNDGEFVGGCIAGGRNYFHINANGDAEPCVFIHYSDANIRDNSILEILRKPLFMAYHNNQPFNKNHLRPCPMLENPEKLQMIVNQTGAKSTDLLSEESVEHLCGKCKKYAEDWKPYADELWKKQED